MWNIQPGVHNGGDRVRNTLLLMVAASCSGAVWGVSSVRVKGDTRPLMVPGWPVKVLFVQLAVLYFFSGYYKVISPLWRSGFVMYWASHDLYWSPGLQGRRRGSRCGCIGSRRFITLVWELGFPVLAAMKRTRAVTLILGVIFHLGTLFTLEVGGFALYSIACYTAFRFARGNACGRGLAATAREAGAAPPTPHSLDRLPAAHSSCLSNTQRRDQQYAAILHAPDDRGRPGAQSCRQFRLADRLRGHREHRGGHAHVWQRAATDEAIRLSHAQPVIPGIARSHSANASHRSFNTASGVVSIRSVGTSRSAVVGSR